jgi:hypothetical protein
VTSFGVSRPLTFVAADPIRSTRVCTVRGDIRGALLTGPYNAHRWPRCNPHPPRNAAFAVPRPDALSPRLPRSSLGGA